MGGRHDNGNGTRPRSQRCESCGEWVVVPPGEAPVCCICSGTGLARVAALLDHWGYL